MGIANLLVLALAVWRVSSLLVNECGPGHVFARLRLRAGIQPVTDGCAPHHWPETFMAELLSCVWCVSVYVGLAAAVAYYLAPVVTVWLCLPLALSAGAILAERIAHG